MQQYTTLAVLYSLIRRASDEWPPTRGVTRGPLTRRASETSDDLHVEQVTRVTTYSSRKWQASFLTLTLHYTQIYLSFAFLRSVRTCQWFNKVNCKIIGRKWLYLQKYVYLWMVQNEIWKFFFIYYGDPVSNIYFTYNKQHTIHRRTERQNLFII